jgi:CubicO group peptidase (beta-lactamase class C family)
MQIAPKPNKANPAFVRAADYSAQHGGFAHLVLEHGRIVFEDFRDGATVTTAHQLASGTKSFWGVAVAAMVQDGAIQLDEKAAGTLTEWQNDARREITVRHLLSFTSGLKPAEMLWRRPDVRDRYAFCVAQPLVAPAGEPYRYDDVHLYALGALLKRKLASRTERDRDVLAYLKRRVFSPIGLNVSDWLTDKAGNPALPMGAILTAREWAKFGEFVRLGGKHDGKQIVDAASLQACFVGSRANRAYGLTWWLNTPARENDVVRRGILPGRRIPETERISRLGIYPKAGADLVMAAGAGGQRCYVWPTQNRVIIRQANRRLLQAMQDRTNNDFDDACFLALLTGAEKEERSENVAVY